MKHGCGSIMLWWWSLYNIMVYIKLYSCVSVVQPKTRLEFNWKLEASLCVRSNWAWAENSVSTCENLVDSRCSKGMNTFASPFTESLCSCQDSTEIFKEKSNTQLTKYLSLKLKSIKYLKKTNTIYLQTIVGRSCHTFELLWIMPVRKGTLRETFY